jgi:hypothetical protein
VARGISRQRRLTIIAVPAFVGAVGVGLVGALALSGSGNKTATPPSGQASTSSSGPTTSVSMDPSPSPKVTRSQAQLPSPPATTSGGLTSRTLPSAKSLGAGWVFRVDQGSAEGGYVGNGTPTLARIPSEVVATVLPLGCDRRSGLPTPSHVLETDYRQHTHGTAGVALRLRFTSSAAAGQFIAARRMDLMACANQAIEPADEGQHLVTGLGATGTGTYVSVRTDPTLPRAAQSWTEIAGWLGGRDVVLLAVNARPTQAVVDVNRLSSAVRGVLR